MDFKFSVVMAVYNKQDYIAEALDSIINQSLNFKKNIQMVIVDDKSTDGTFEILEDYKYTYPNNILLIQNEKNMGPAYSRNRGLKYANGEFINFLDSDDTISKNAFKHAYNFLKANPQIDIASIPIYYFGVKRGPHNLNFKFKEDQIINLDENPDHIQLSGPSSFIKASKLKKYQFNNNLKVSEDALLINQMLLDNPVIGFIKGDKYNYRKDGTQNSLITSSANTKTYFTTRFDEYFFKLIDCAEKKGKIPKFIQYVLMYDLQWIVEIRKIDHLLSESEIKTLRENIFKVLKYVDEDVILAQRSIPANLKAHVVLMKRHGWDYLEDKESVEDNFNLNAVFIDNFVFKNDHEIEISGILTNFTKDTDIIAVVDSKEIPTDKIRYPQRDNYSLSFNYGFNHCFKVKFQFKENTKISFKTQKIPLKIEYNQTSRLNDTSKFKISKDHIAIDEGNEISITKFSHLKLLKLEYNIMKGMLKNRSQGWKTGVFIRFFNILAFPFYINRHMWLFMDLPAVAGDNALELFKYVKSQNPKIKPYFVLDKCPEDEYDYLVSSRMHKLKRFFGFGKSTEQYKEIKKQGNVLAYKSFKHRIYTLLCDYIITSHPDNTLIYPFWGNYPYLSGIAKSKTVFLQHGVTKDNVSEWLNDFDKPLAMLVTVSDREKESFKNPDYGYDMDIIKTLGFPRFDRLENNPKKEIVLMPSWRRNLDQLSPTEFVKTNFYKVFNELITDDELIETLTKEGYKLIFKPHRNLHKFIDAYTRHPDVKFDLNLENYTQTFNTASILISDYSSVSFDFAYMKKPIIYYQFDKDYHFDVDSAYFKYESDGFGPVAKDHTQLKEMILNLIANDCKMDEKYEKRVDSFFKYHDKNNSKRVYEEILKLDYYY